MRKLFGLRSNQPALSKAGPAENVNPNQAASSTRSKESPHDPIKTPKQVAFTTEPPALKAAPSFESTVSHHGALQACFQPKQSAQQVSQPARQAFPSYQHPNGLTTVPQEISRSVSPMSMSSTTSFGYNSTSYSHDSDSTFVRPAVTWAQMVYNFSDLAENLGERERIRQEVLWEIVASEERYVQELLIMTELYVEPLLHPDRSPTTSPSISPSISSIRQYQSPDMSDQGGAFTPLRKDRSMSSDHLPIASRFSKSPIQPSINLNDSHVELSQPSINVGLGLDNVKVPVHDRIVSDSSNSSTAIRPHKLSGLTNQTPASKSRQSLPASFTHTFPAQSFRHHLKSLSPQPHKLHKSRATPTKHHEPLIIPEALRVLLDTIGDALVVRHQTLSTLLKERWQAQYPLVRNLAGVWVDQTWIVHDYRNYVLHLEKGLEDVSSILATVSSPKNKKGNAVTEEERNMRRLAKHVMKLEEHAATRGESGLAICLSKPFQRLLKYPLLFQNLLYHTDASTVEYESTRSLALELDTVVKSIENDKISEEERDRMHDLWARIEGMNDKALMAPTSERFLLNETSLWQPPHGRRSVSNAGKGDQPSASKTHISTKGQKTVRRLSDMVGMGEKDKQPTLGSKRDIWLIQLSDVVIRCQRIGETALPVNALLNHTDVKAKAKSAIPFKKRNLYRFLGIERWEERNADIKSEFGLIDMPTGNKDPSLSHSISSDKADLESQDVFQENGGISRMSFSYANDVPKPRAEHLATLPQSQRSFPLSKLSPNLGHSFMTPSNTMQSATSRRGPQAAKFEHRLRGASAQPRSLSPNPQQRSYEAPTQAYLSKISRPNSPILSRPSSRNSNPHVRALNASGSSVDSEGPRTPTNEFSSEPITVTRSNSGMILYSKYWDEAKTPKKLK